MRTERAAPLPSFSLRLDLYPHIIKGGLACAGHVSTSIPPPIKMGGTEPVTRWSPGGRFLGHRYNTYIKGDKNENEICPKGYSLFPLFAVTKQQFSQHFQKQKLQKSQILELIQGSSYVLNTEILSSNKIQMCSRMIRLHLTQEKQGFQLIWEAIWGGLSSDYTGRYISRSMKTQINKL